MKESDKFDEIISSKFSGKEFPFDEENWERVEAKLESDRKRKKAWRFGLIFFVGLLAGIAIMLPFMNNEVAENKIISQVVHVTAAPVVKDSLKETTIAETPQTAENNISAETNVPKGETVIEKVEKLHEMPLLPPVKKVMHEDVNIEHTENTVKAIEEPTNILPAETASDMASLKKDNIVEQKEPAKTQQDSVAELKSGEAPEPVVFMGMNFKMDTTGNKRVNDLQHKIDSLSQVIADSFAKDSITQKKDSAAAIPPAVRESTSTPADSPSLIKANTLSVVAGADYDFGWQYGDTTEAKGFNPVLGLGYTHLFNQHLSFQTGIQYGSIGHLNASTKTFTTSNPDFGINNVDSVIDTRWMHYMVLPLFINYHLNSKNSIGIGGSVSYLVNTTSDLITNTYSDFKDPLQTVKKSFGYMQGFSPWNAAFAITYRRKISTKFNASAEMHYGLIDIKDNAFFSKQKLERNSGIKLTLAYDIFDY